MKKLVLSMGMSVALLGWQHAAMAVGTLLPPSGSVSPVPSVTYGGTLVGNYIGSFNTGGLNPAVGTVQSWVYSGDASNPFNGVGGLTFVYLISNTGAGTLGYVETFTVNDYTSATAYVGYSPVLGTGPVVPTSVGRSILGTPITWNFSAGAGGLGAIPAGGSSKYLVVETDATSWALDAGGVIDSLTSNVGLLGPSIPDGGATVALLGLALAGLAGVRRMF